MDVLQKAFTGTDARVTRNEALLARQSNTVEAVAKRFIDQDAKPKYRELEQDRACARTPRADKSLPAERS